MDNLAKTRTSTQSPPRSDSDRSKLGLMFRFLGCQWRCRVTCRRILEPENSKAAALVYQMCSMMHLNLH